MIITTPYQYPELSRVTKEQGRHYEVGGARALPSVTTILDATSDKTALIDWRARVGDVEADRISQESTKVGNHMHENLENYILEGTKPDGSMLVRLLTDQVIKKGLKKVDEVWGVEVGLYNPELYAGTTDLVGVHEGAPAIMDFKNSRKFKRKEWIENYFMQLVAYGESHNHMFGTDINKGVVMISCWSGHYQEFIIEGEVYNDYKTQWYDKVYAYYEKYGIQTKLDKYTKRQDILWLI